MDNFELTGGDKGTREEFQATAWQHQRQAM